jgi:hypothetical protein
VVDTPSPARLFEVAGSDRRRKPDNEQNQPMVPRLPRRIFTRLTAGLTPIRSLRYKLRGVDALNCMSELVTRGSRERMVKPATESLCRFFYGEFLVAIEFL